MRSPLRPCKGRFVENGYFAPKKLMEKRHQMVAKAETLIDNSERARVTPLREITDLPVFARIKQHANVRCSQIRDTFGTKTGANSLW